MFWRPQLVNVASAPRSGRVGASRADTNRRPQISHFHCGKREAVFVPRQVEPGQTFFQRSKKHKDLELCPLPSSKKKIPD